VKGRSGSASIRVVDTDAGTVWAEATPELAENPASNMKLITAAVALDRLGPDFSFSTGLYGEVAGDRVETLVLRGEGDPTLTTLDLAELAQVLAHLGVASVGQILVDQTRFDDQFVPPAFAQQPDEWASFRAPVSAVALDRNAVTLFVAPSTAGQPARVWFEPPGVVAVDGAIETRNAGAGEAVQLGLEMRGEQLTARLGGHVAQGLPRLRFDRRLEDPRRAPGLVLRELLLGAHVQVQGSVGLGGADVKGRLAFHESNTLAALLPMLGKHSDNFTAEMLFKVLGARATGQPASSADGAKVVRDWLTAHALASAETRIENGSGLFDADRVSARTLSGVLEVARRDPAIFPEYLAQLSIGGVDGTLHGRFRKFRAQRNIRAKTGTLAAASALSGYVLPPNAGAPIAFSILVNGIEGQAAAVRDHIDHVVEVLAESVSRPLAGSAEHKDIKTQSLGQAEDSHAAQQLE
jgi:D-alanyl-D-alanine carboxypeptidase/D-alanyl-D-alanine-endopeptidase (penicillin-binding protein 4)